MKIRLTAVTIRTWNRSRTWFLNLPVVDGKVHLSSSRLDELIMDWGLPRSTTISIG